jgi:HlyD family secretion protein
MRRVLKPIILAILMVGAAGAGARTYYLRGRTLDRQITTAAVTGGSVVDTVTATGTLQAVSTVQVGSQVSGTISWLGADFNSIVRAGQVIAKLDPSLFEAQVEQARANVARAKADADRTRVQLDDARQKFARAEELSVRQLVSRSDFDAARVAVDSAVAQLHGSEAQVVQAQASLNQNEVTLAHTVITAPIAGIVVERNVDNGQTVAATLQSPTVFTIAADLSRMQVKADIDESDIGRVRQGQVVAFSVDAFPGQTFSGVLTEVRLQPTVAQNVTTYNVMIDAPNPSLELKPGMTANVRIEIARRDNAMRMPNAALRFRPSAEMLADDGDTMPPVQKSERGRSVWIVSDGKLQPVPVTVGITDGVNTELVGDSLALGTELVTAVTSGDTAAATVRPQTSNPFAGFQPTSGRSR